MADKKITELPLLSNVTVDDFIVVVDNATTTTYKATANTFVNSIVTAFLDRPDEFEETTLYFYMGWESVNSSWLVRKQTRSDSSTVDATVSNNGSYANLTEAWADRNTLTYI